MTAQLASLAQTSLDSSLNGFCDLSSYNLYYPSMILSKGFAISRIDSQYSDKVGSND